MAIEEDLRAQLTAAIKAKDLKTANVFLTTSGVSKEPFVMRWN